MKKTLVAAAELEQWLTAKLRKLDDCHDCKVSGVLPLQEPDEQGCNWSDSLVVNAGGLPYDYYAKFLSVVVAEARSRFNLK